jgi:hypothetical protein
VLSSSYRELFSICKYGQGILGRQNIWMMLGHAQQSKKFFLETLHGLWHGHDQAKVVHVPIPELSKRCPEGGTAKAQEHGRAISRVTMHGQEKVVQQTDPKQFSSREWHGLWHDHATACAKILKVLKSLKAVQR